MATPKCLAPGRWSHESITTPGRSSSPARQPSTNTGTGGGLIPGYPLNREGFASHIGEFWVGGKFNFMSELDKKPAAVAVRAMIKFPTGSKEPAGTTSGQTDFLFDGIVSKRAKNAEVSGYVGYIFRGNPSGYNLTNGFRWGFGAEFPNKDKYGIKIVSELFGEAYSNKTITAPPGLVGTDGSFVPLSTTLKNPVIWDIGLTWQASNGFYVGTAWSWNLTMETRDKAVPFAVHARRPTRARRRTTPDGSSALASIRASEALWLRHRRRHRHRRHHRRL